MKPLDRINGYAHVAVCYGLEESIFLDSLMYWYKTNRANQRNFEGGRWWTFNSISALADLFPWWSAKQIRRIIASCKEQGALLSGNYNEDRRDRTLWYTPSDDLLKLYNYDCAEEGKSICPDGQVSIAQTGKCNIEHVNTHVNTNTPYSPPEGDKPTAKPPKASRRRREAKAAPDWMPERFAGFWGYYPRGESKQAASPAVSRLQYSLNYT